MGKRSWKDVYSGGFLKAADVPRHGKRVKITAIEEEVLRSGERPKLVAELKGFDQRWVLNATNCELLEKITGSEDPDDWIGPQIELFNDRSVRGPNGERGGIRCRAASKSKKKRSEVEENLDDSDDDELDGLDDDED